MQKRSATWEHKQYPSIYWLIGNQTAKKMEKSECWVIEKFRLRVVPQFSDEKWGTNRCLRKITVLETRKQRGRSEVLNDAAKTVLKWLSKKGVGQILNF